jgi:ASC-1-like (ASCH) protein
MDHVAIMKKSWKLTDKVANGEKKIESRWYKSKRSPWNQIKAGETVYFKNAGEPVCLKAKVKRVMQFSGLTPKKVKEILNKYAKADGIEKNKIGSFFRMFKDKKYCLLVFLKNPLRVRPFLVKKSGFGLMSAWLTMRSISQVKIANNRKIKGSK